MPTSDGTAADCAGPLTPESPAPTPASAYRSQRGGVPATASAASAALERPIPTSETTMRRRRSIRSASGPATSEQPMRATAWARPISPTASDEPVWTNTW